MWAAMSKVFLPLLVAALLALAGCSFFGVDTVAGMQILGTRTARFESSKTPMEFVDCVVPIYDSQIPGFDAAQIRHTPVSVQVLKTLSQPVSFRFLILSMIEVLPEAQGSSIVGFITPGDGKSRHQNLASIIQQRV